MTDEEYLIRDLRDIIRNKNNVIEDLEKQLDKTRSDKEHAEYRVKQELEPRIKAEERVYDIWVSNGGSDPCMRNGMNGNCNPDCEAFGSEDGCFEYFTDMPDEDFLEYYRENGDEHEEVVGLLFERGLWKQKMKIDNDYHKSECYCYRVKFFREIKRMLSHIIYNFKNRKGI